MKPTIEALLDNFRERSALEYLGTPWSAKGSLNGAILNAHDAGHDALAPLLVKAVEALKAIGIKAGEEGRRDFYGDIADKARIEIEAALAQGTEARGKGEKR